MKAIECQVYNDINAIQVVSREKPIPKKNELLIQVHAATVQTADWRVQSQNLPSGFGYLGRLAFGLFRPRQPVLGTELSGQVVAIGSEVQDFAVGDEVVHVSGATMGCHVEYKCVSQKSIVVKKPHSLSHEQAVAIPFGYSTAWNFLVVKAKLQPEDKVLVIGGSGSVGIAAVQIAKHFGADVFATCSKEHLDFVRHNGATDAFDYSTDALSRSGHQFDLVIDAFGQTEIKQLVPFLKPKARVVSISGSLWDILLAPIRSLTTSFQFISGLSLENKALIKNLLDLAATQKIQPQIDTVYPLEKAAQAFSHVGRRHKKGTVVLKVH